MANKHIKVINGRKYYYQSIRVGKRVTSKYLGPVQRIRKPRQTFENGGIAKEQSETDPQEQPQQEETYIG